MCSDSNDDSLTLQGSSSVTGTYAGGAGTDTLSYAGYGSGATVTVGTLGVTDGFNLTATATGGASDINVLTGSSNPDSLTGRATTATFEVDGSNRYIDTANGNRAIAFSAVENLTGNTGIDTFTVTAAHTGNLDGADNDDVFTVTDAVLTGSVSGNGGADQVTVGGTGGQIAGNVDGGSENDTVTLNSNGNITGTVDGGAGADQITLNATSTIVGNVSGSGGIDQITLNGSSNITGTVDGGSEDDAVTPNGTSTITGSVLGSAGNDTLSLVGSISTTRVTGTFTGGAGSDTVNYAGATVTGATADLDAAGTASGIGTAFTESVENFIGSDFADTITIDATAATTRTIEGNDPTAVTGDTLNVDGLGSAFTFNPGALTFGNGGVVNYSEVETLSVTNVSTTLNITGAAGDDIFTVNATNATDGSYTLTDDANTFSLTVAFTNATSLSFDGGTAGDDSFTLNNASAAFAPTGGVSFVGGEGTEDEGGDLLVLTGAGVGGTTGSYSPTGAEAGTLTVVDGATQTITFSQIEQAIQDNTQVTSYSVNASAAANAISVVNGASGRVSVSTTGFIAYEFSAKTNVSVNAGDANDVVTVNYSNTPTALSTLTVNGDDQDDTFFLVLTPAAVTTTANGGDGNDDFNINATGVKANLNGDGGADDFFFDANTDLLTGAITGGTGSDQLTYAGRSNAVTVTLGLGTTADGFTGSATAVGGGFKTIDVFTGGGGTDTFKGAQVASTWNLGGTNTYAQTTTPPATATFSSFETLTGGALVDTFKVNAAFAGTVDGGTGNDVLDYGANATGTSFSVTGSNQGSAGTVNFVSTESVIGSTANDTFTFQSTAAKFTGTVNGGGGTANSLVYSAAGYTAAVRVNLTLGTASATGGISNFRDVSGGAGDDILIGNAGNNVLTGNGGTDIISGNAGDDTIDGGAGNNILIGGDGADAITGGTSDDILIGGITTYDNDINALNSIMAEWRRTDVSTATKVARLSGAAGGLNNGFVFTASTVSNDGDTDTLNGGGGSNWFIVSTGDVYVIALGVDFETVI